MSAQRKAHLFRTLAIGIPGKSRTSFPQADNEYNIFNYDSLNINRASSLGMQSQVVSPGIKYIQATLNEFGRLC